MNSVGRFHIVFIVFLLTMLGYCCHILLRPSFTIISLSATTGAPSYTHNTRLYMIDSYVPKVTSRTYDHLFLDSVLSKDSIYKILNLDA
jgi:hypothetical protein